MRMIERRTRRATGILLIAIAALVATGTLTAGASVNAAKRKHLSLDSVTIVGSEINAFFAPVWIAKEKGYFSKLGINNVTILNITTSGSDAIAALLGGSAQFVNANASATGLAVQNHAPVRTVFVDNYGTETEIALNATTLAAKGIPTTGTTAAGAKAQLLALKGSHLTIDFPNNTGDPYTNLLALAKTYGLTVGPGGDFNVGLTGSASNSIAAFNSGKADGFGSTPPNTVQNNAAILEMGKIAPVSKGIDNLISTTTSMIKSHADTVQAFVTALVESYNMVVQHPTEAERIQASLFSLGSINSPEEQQYLFAHYRATASPTPAGIRSGYTFQKEIFNLVEATPFNVPLTDWFDNKFVDKAIRQLGYKYATGP